MRPTLLTLTMALPLLSLAACDSPEDEAELQELDQQAELQPEERAETPAKDDSTNAHAPLELRSSVQGGTASGCHYKVVWPVAGLYDNPGSNKLKNKYAGDIVGEICNWLYYDGQYEWIAVNTASAGDGIGWIRHRAVVNN